MCTGVKQIIIIIIISRKLLLLNYYYYYFQHIIIIIISSKLLLLLLFPANYYYYYYYHYYYYYRISHFSVSAGKHSPTLRYVINSNRLGGLICSLKSSLQLNMFQELQIFAFVCTYWGAG
jgi:hypothetical protein